MPKRLLHSNGLKTLKGQKMKVTRNTLVKNPRPKKEVAKRDKVATKRKVSKKKKKK